MSGFEDIKLKGTKAFRLKDYTEARQLYDECLRARPKDVTIMSNLAQVHIELGNYCHALVHAQNGLELDPTHVKCLYRCGVANRHLGNYENALHALQKAKQLVGFYKSSSKLPARMKSAGAHKTENGDES